MLPPWAWIAVGLVALGGLLYAKANPPSPSAPAGNVPPDASQPSGGGTMGGSVDQQPQPNVAAAYAPDANANASSNLNSTGGVYTTMSAARNSSQPAPSGPSPSYYNAPSASGYKGQTGTGLYGKLYTATQSATPLAPQYGGGSAFGRNPG